MPRRSRPKKFLVLFLAFFLPSLALDWIAGPPLAVDEPISLGLWVAICLHFFFWLGAMHSWGQILRNRASPEGEPAGMAIALGSLAYALVAALFACAGLLKPELRYGLWALQAVGMALLPPPTPRMPKNKITLLALLPLALLFFLNFADAWIISPYWDPLHHHLASVRLFWENGKMYFPRTAIAAYQEGGFEMLFLWPHFFFARAGGLGLLPAQIFGQLTHLFVGFGGSLLLAHALAERWLPNSLWRAIAVTLFAIPISLQFAIPTAKNDWGIVLWVLAGFCLLLPTERESIRQKNFRIFLAGLLWGFAWLAKLSAGFAIAGLLSFFCFHRWKRKEYGVWALGILLGTLPFALRNYFGTGNPFFPLFDEFFGAHAVGPTWREALAKYHANPLGFGRITEWMQEYPLAILALASPLLALRRREEASLRAAALALAIGFLLFSFNAGAATELRLLGALLPLSALLLGVLLQRIGERLPFRAKYFPAILLSLLALLLPYRWESIARFGKMPAYNHLLVRGYVSGEAQGWFRDHFRPGMRAALLSEARFYHSIPFPVVRLWDAPEIDAKLREAKSPGEFLRTLSAEGFTQLILSDEKLDLFYPKDQVAAVEAYVLNRPETFLFSSAHSIVADLAKLTEVPAQKTK